MIPVVPFIIFGFGSLLSILGMKVRYDKTSEDHGARRPDGMKALALPAGLIAGIIIMSIVVWCTGAIVNMWCMITSIIVGVMMVAFLITMEWYTSIRWTEHDDVIRFWMVGSTMLLAAIVPAMGLPYVAGLPASTVIMALTSLLMYVMTQAEDWHVDDDRSGRS